MASYDTKAVTIGDITVTISKKKDATAGERLKALLEFIASKLPVDPGYGVDGGLKPDQGLPGGGGAPPKPDQGLPGSGNRPDNTLPGQPPKPDQGLPPTSPGQPTHPIAPGGRPPHVDNSLPGEWLKEHADEIVKIVLGKCVDCRPDGPQPK